MKKTLFYICLIISFCLFIELSSCIGLFVLKNNDYLSPVDSISRRHSKIISKILHEKSNYIRYSADLGWSVREMGKTDWYTANSTGMRSSKEYGMNIPDEKFRIVLCGDGFVHCNDVKDHEAWPALIEQYNPDWEVLNFGVWAYALDQIYLRYLKNVINYKSNIVIIGVGSGNIFRLVNTYRPFIFRHTGMPLAKPRFRIENGKLKLIPNPMSTIDDYKMLLEQPKQIIPILGIEDYYFKRRNLSHKFEAPFTIKMIKTISGKMRENSDNKILFQGEYTEIPEAFDIMIKLTDAFHELVSMNESIPVFCIFPLKEDIIRFRNVGKKRYSQLLKYFKARGYEYIDMMHAFDKIDKSININNMFIDFYSPMGNQLVAEYMDESLNRIKSGFKSSHSLLHN